METSPQKRKRKKNDTANHLKQSKLHACSDPCLLTSRVHCCIQTTTRIQHLANLSELN
ncbi:mCG55961 [Mus musculus]|nr:mCG55961 [Mus musculus]